jgi:hypothetical protein
LPSSADDRGARVAPGSPAEASRTRALCWAVECRWPDRLVPPLSPR